MVKVFLLSKENEKRRFYESKHRLCKFYPYHRGLIGLLLSIVIAYASSRSDYGGDTFETVWKEFDELMRILKEALEVAGQEADMSCQCQNKCRRDFKY